MARAAAKVRRLFVPLFVCGCQQAATVLEVPPDGDAPDGDSGPQIAVMPPALPVTSEPAASCGRFREGEEFRLCSATYVGTTGEDRAAAVGVGADGEVIVAGNFDGAPFALHAQGEPRDGSGAVVRLNAEGTEALALTRVGATIRDADVQQRGAYRIALATDVGVSVLEASADEHVWEFLVDGGAWRVAIGSDGTVAALGSDQAVHVFSPAGVLLSAFEIDEASLLTDIAIDDVGGTVFVAGGRNATSPCAGHFPYLAALGFDGELKWRAYDFDEEPMECASSLAIRIDVGRDGMLYYAGHSDGGSNVHLRDPMDLASVAPVRSYDAYTTGSGRARQTSGFIARFEPSTGQMLLGQVLLPRNGDIGGRLVIGGITADETGNVYVTGEASCCIAERDELELMGVAPGPFGNGDMFVAILARDFTRRLSWVTWTGEDGTSAVGVGIAVGPLNAAVVANQRGSDRPMITYNPLQPRPADSEDAFLSVWPTAVSID